MTPATRAAGTPASVIALITVFSLILSLFAQVAPVTAHHGEAHPLVTPTTFPGATNRTCGDVDDADYEFKINIENPNGTFKQGSTGVTVTPNEPTDFEVTIVTSTVGGQKYLSFDANLPVQSVFLKGGVNGSNLYDYAEYPTKESPEPVSYDEKLQVPGGSDISHVSFCFDELPLFPALEISKSPTGGVVNAGDDLSFTITVTNTGDAAALNVDVDDNLDTRFTWTDDKDECAINAGMQLHCDIPSLAAKASFSVTVTAPTDGSVCANIPNVAYADADGVNQISDSGDITIRCADIRIEKTPDEDEQNPSGNDVEIGDAITFVLTVHNDGSGEARGVEVFDDLPGTGWSIAGGAATTLSNCAISSAAHPTLGNIGQWLSCPNNTIAAGDSKTVTVSRTAVYPGDCGEIDNLAKVTTTNNGFDEDAGNIDVLCASIEVDKTPDGGQVTAGDAATFTILTSNTGSATATGVELTDALPIVELGWSIVAAGTDWADCEITGLAGAQQTLTCGPESIGAGDDLTVKVTATATAEDCGLLDNPKAEATTTNDGSAQDAGDITVLCAEIHVDKTPDGAEVYAGDTVAFTIVTTNLGDGEARDVELSDSLPAVENGWEIDSTKTDWVDCAITGDAGGPQLLECGPEHIAAGEANTRSVVVTTIVTAEDCGALNNPKAEVTTSNDGSDSDAGSMTVLCPDVGIEKEGGDPVTAGELASFQIAVTAAGTGTSKNVMVTDELIGAQADWTFGVTGADEGDCSINAEPKLVCDFGDLDPGTEITITLTYQTDASDCPSIANSATVSSDNDTDASNNQAGPATVSVNCPDLKIDKELVDSPISAGELAEFTIKVWNIGPGTATDVVVTDTAPAGTLWEVLDDGGFNCDDEVVDGQQTLTCTLDELEAGLQHALTILIGYETSRDDCGMLENHASVAGGNEPQSKVGDDNADEATIVVECPGLNMIKVADADPIDAGETAGYTITVWNTGPGKAFDVVIEDTIPAGWAFDHSACDSAASSVVGGGDENWSCTIDELGVTEMAGGIQIRISGPTTRDDCGLLTNTAFASASNSDDALERSDTITVKCPTISLEKDNDADGPVLPGTTVTYSLTLTIDDGPAKDVEVVDTLPAGLDSPTNISDGGVFDGTAGTITWSLGDLADGEYTLTYQAAVSESAEHGDELVNVATATSSNSQCPNLDMLEPECEDTSTVLVRVPTLTIEKAADADEIVISGPNDALVADPAVVTWTLTYTLTNGPVTNAVISDELPAGLVYVDGSASDGGVYDVATNTLTWTFATLTESGSVTYETEVDPETISRVAPTVNVAVIASDQTPEDEGQDEVSVVVEPPPLAGTPTPKPKLPDTALGIGPNGEPITVPIELLVAFFLGSLGVLTLANVRTARSRRR